MTTIQFILTAFLGFSLGIIALLQIKAVKDTIKDARELAKALSTNQNLKGQYGEDCLETILNSCFLQKDINYIKQYITINKDNKEIKPDYILHLPNNKSILIDCKLNLDKYIEYTKHNNTKSKNEFIKDINITINNLSNKKYHTALNINQPDFILMYIPIEAITTMIYTDKDCINIVKNANEKNIIIVSNSSILTTIRLVKLLWAQDTQNKNIENIINLAQKIYNSAAIHSNILYNIKEVINQNSEKLNKEYEKFNSDEYFKAIEQLKQYGIEAQQIKSGSKLEDNNINRDFLIS